MLYFLLLNLLFSTDVLAQNMMLKKGPKASTDAFVDKTILGSWGTDTANFNHDVLRGAIPLSIELIPKKIVFPEDECNKDQAFLLSLQQEQNIQSISAPFTVLHCQESDKLKNPSELNPEVCLMLANCFRGKTPLGEGVYGDLKRSREKTASEAVALMSSTTISQLYDLEEFKTYAIEKFGDDILPQECRGSDPMEIPQAEDSACNTNIIDKGYELAQKSCNLVEVGCNPDFLKFSRDKKTENGKSSLLVDFIKNKSQKMAQLFSTEDFSITQDLAHLMTKNTSPEIRAQNVLDYLARNYTSLDPVYKSYLKQSNTSKSNGEKDEIYEGILKYIKSNGNKNPLEVLNELDILRRKETSKILAEDCQKVMSIPKLCRIVTDVLSGAEIQVPKKNFDQLMKRQTFSSSGPHMSIQDLADNVSRCNTFSIDLGIGINGSNTVKLSNGKNLLSNGPEGLYLDKDINSKLGFISVTHNPKDLRSQYVLKGNGDLTKKDRLSLNIVEKLSSAKEITRHDTVLVSKFSNNLIHQPDTIAENVLRTNISSVAIKSKSQAASDLSTISIAKDSVTTDKLQPQFQQQNLINPKGVLPNGVRLPDTISENQTEYVKKEPVVKPRHQTTEYAQMMNKIAGLEEKLATAQKKSAVEAVPSDSRAVEESDLVRELRMAKASLVDINKASNDAKVNATSAASTRKKTQFINERRNESGNEEVEEDSVTSSTPAKEVRSANTGQSSNLPINSSTGSNSASSSSSDRSPASVESSGSISRGSNSGLSGESLFSIGEGLVLTRLDGISRSKVTEAISKMILAESGKPFFIEEGGYVKEIIPEVVNGLVLKDEDGVPVYKTVVKGKVGEFKVDSKGKRIKKEVVATATSPADVKIQDNQKIKNPAVRYRELQEVLNIKK